MRPVSTDDTDAWRLHGSWLRAHGDPRAGLVELAATDTPADRAALATALANNRASWTPDGVTANAYTWRHGFVVAAATDVAGHADAHGIIRLLADPCARLLGGLRLNIGDEAPSRGLSLLAAADLGRLRTLQAPITDAAIGSSLRWSGSPLSTCASLACATATTVRAWTGRHRGLHLRPRTL